MQHRFVGVKGDSNVFKSYDNIFPINIHIYTHTLLPSAHLYIKTNSTAVVLYMFFNIGVGSTFQEHFSSGMNEIRNHRPTI